jgi:pathogenesis-related protein 1
MPPPPKTNADDFLRRVNEMRSAHDADPLVWDYALADYATRWSEQAYNYAGGPLVHSGGPYGENIFVTHEPDIQQALTQAACAWYSEAGDYDFGAPGFTAGHFTALVWRGTRRVGLGWTRKDDGALVIVASFDPAGNVDGLYETNISRPRANPTCAA